MGLNLKLTAVAFTAAAAIGFTIGLRYGALGPIHTP